LDIFESRPAKEMDGSEMEVVKNFKNQNNLSVDYTKGTKK